MRKLLLIKTFVFFSLSVFLFSQLVMQTGCANIIPPQGGPRDSIPPVLIKSNPGDSTRNFTGNKITLTFDEYVDLQGVQENLIVSPNPTINPIVSSRLNVVTIKLRDTLESNTTYSVSLGNAIRDFTEGNPIKGFKYTFSTGRYIDSLELSGDVVLAENGKLDTTLIVILHTLSNDSAVVNQSPRYIAHLDSKGHFVFRNLPQKTFYLYALKDEGGTHRYLTEKSLFAFADKPVTPSLNPEPVTLYAYIAKQSAPETTTTPTLNPGGNRLGIKSKAGLNENRLRYETNLSAGQQDLLNNFVMTFQQPLRSFDTSKIRLYTDSSFIPALYYHFKKDSTNKKIVLEHEWKENTLYHIILDKEFATDSAGKKLLKTDTLNFTTKKVADYGSLQIKFRNLDLKKNPVLYFVTNDVIYKTMPLNSETFSQTLFLPGEYELRILYDNNKNGVWDPGKFFGKHQQPELVKPIDRRITVKPAWQNEFEIEIK